MSRYAVEVNTSDYNPFFLWEEYLETIYPHEYITNLAQRTDDKGGKSIIFTNDKQALRQEQSLARFAGIYRDKIESYIDKSGKYDFYIDDNSVIGYDPMLETWFLQAFETTIDDCDTLMLWLGTQYREFFDINELMAFLYKAGIWLFISESDLRELMEEASDLGCSLKNLSPLLKASFFSDEVNRLIGR